MPPEKPQIISFLKNIHPFRKMNDPEVAQVAEMVEFFSFQAGENIFQQDDVSEYLCIVQSGKVSLSHEVFDDLVERLSHTESLGTLNAGDIFGFEVWHGDMPRETSAKALTAATVMCIKEERLKTLANNSPLIDSYLGMMLESYLNTLLTPMEWLNTDEPVILMAHAHPMFIRLRLLVPFVLIAFMILMPMTYLYFFVFPQLPALLLLDGFAALSVLIWGTWVYFDWANDYYVLTDRRIVLQEKVALLYDSRQEASLEFITSLSFQTGYWGRLFSYGNVILRTTNGVLTLAQTSNPQQVISIIEERQKRITSGRPTMEKQSKEDLIRQRLGYAILARPAASTPPPSEPETFIQWIASKIQMRSDANGVITYHTHWYVLFKRIWAPTLLLLIFPIFWISLFFGWFAVLPISFIIIGSMLGVTSSFLWWLYAYYDWRNDIYVINDEQIIDIHHKPLGQEEKRVAPLKNIQSIEYKRQGLTGLLLNFGTVLIRVGEDMFSFDYVHNPAEVQREMFLRLSRRKQKDKQAEMEGERLRMLEWLEAYHNAVNSTPGKNT